MQVYLDGKRVRLDPRRSVGKGGEADVFALPGEKAVKVWKGPDHPDYAGLPQERDAARRRLDVYQRKLRRFPSDLPGRVVAPEQLASDRSGKRLLGFTMRLLRDAVELRRFAEPAFRSGRIGNEVVQQVFLRIHETVAGLHERNVVIGDFNDLNVLVRDADAYFIDADSFQFDGFACPAFTTRFVDPLLCEPKQRLPTLSRPHTADSDWYAFAVMLMQSLLFVGPYGGVYQAKGRAGRIPHDARPLHRITVFHPDVRYPKPARPLETLPDEILHFFREAFERDRRGRFPRDLLESIRWTICNGCGIEHARSRCPACACTVPVPAMAAAPVRGKVTVTEVFLTHGQIVAAALCDGKLRWLSHEEGRFRREDGSVVCEGELAVGTRIRLRGEETLVGRRDGVVRLAPDRAPAQMPVGAVGGVPMFDANSAACYWVEGDRLMRDGPLGAEFIGDVLAGQTRFWVGERFGFGFYRAGELSVAFVFDARRRGINDRVSLPPLRGQLIDADCAFAEDRCWFLTATEESGNTVNRCWLIRRDGAVEAMAESGGGEYDWLAAIHGRCAAGPFLFAATDEGIVRIEADGGRIAKTRDFPDAEPFVDSQSRLFAGRGGLYVVGPRTIRLLKLA